MYIYIYNIEREREREIDRQRQIMEKTYIDRQTHIDIYI
jgi:hypothetical protein